MAIMKTSITTRYGDTFSSDGDSIDGTFGTADFVALDSDIVLDSDNHTITVGTAQSGTDVNIIAPTVADGDYVIFNKRINIVDQNRFHTGGNAGVHFWFVNCIINQEGDATDSRQTFGTADNQNANPGGQGGTISGTKASDTTFNYYGCTFVFDTDAVVGVYNVGTIEDCSVVLLGDNSNGFQATPIFQVQAGTEFDGLVIDGQTKQGMGITPFISGTDAVTLDGLVLNNVMPYVNGRDLKFVDYEQSANGATRFSNETRFLLAGNNAGVSFVNPKTPLTGDGDVAWRATGNSSKVIIRQGFQRDYFKTPDTSASNGRDDVKIVVETNATTTSNDPSTYNFTSATRSTFTYTTESDGVPEGTIDLNDANGTVTKQDFATLEIPVAIVRSDNTSTNVESGSKTEYHESELFNYTVDVTEMSLWGTRFVEHGKNGGDIVLSTADANGYFVPPDELTVVDGDDSVMLEYSETVANITGALTTTDSTSISLNDLAANWKYHVWNDEDFGEWDSDTISGSEFDVTVAGGTTDGIVLDPSATDTSSFSATLATFTCPTSATNEVTISVSDDDVIKSLKCDTLNVSSGNELLLDGGSYEITDCATIKTFSSIPGSDDYSIRNATIEGKITVPRPANAGDTNYVKLDNVTIESGKTFEVDASNTGNGNIVVLFTGTNDGTLNLDDANVSQSIVYNITLTGLSADYIAGNLVLQAATSDTSTVGTFFDKDDSKFTIAGDNTDREIDIQLLVASNQTHLWLALCYDEGTDGAFDPVVLTDTSDVNHTIALTSTTVDGITFTESDTDADDWDLTALTVAAFTSATSNVDVEWTDITGSTFSKATAAQTREVFRKDIIESTNYLQGMAQGFIANDYFQFESGAITVPADTTRLDLTHASNTGAFYRFDINLISRATAPTDFFQTAGKSTTPATAVEFKQKVDAVTLSELQAEMDNRLVTEGNLTNLGLQVPVKGTDGNLATSPDV